MLVHNRYLIRGGEEESAAAEREVLCRNGPSVDLYQEHNERVVGLSKLRLALRLRRAGIVPQRSRRSIRS